MSWGGARIVGNVRTCGLMLGLVWLWSGHDRPVRTTFTYPFDEDYAYSTPHRNASALPASPFQFMSPATLPMHTPCCHNQRSLVSASSFDANMHPLSDRQLPPATSSPLPLSHDDFSTSPYPLIHSARPCPVAGTAQEAKL
ncbi:hypothetical protein F5051DRAFT_447507 [Lentinula edodes]|nr:hypothetical protein F5051DRAFT_447507 [Lentinula edodes]